MNQPDDFEGYLTPEGELVSIEDVDAMLSVLSKRTENRDEIVQWLWALGWECCVAGFFSAAYCYCEKILSLLDAPGEKQGVC